VDVVLKPKRATDPRIYEGSIYRSLVDKSSKWQKAGRLFPLNPNIDPYLPIALADMCIGMPFTSPVVVALNAGKPAFWYDPAAEVNDLFPRDIREVLVSGQSQLYERMANSNAVHKVPVSLLCGDSDPGEIFSAIITGARLSTV
jgi:polysaccharide biosynthesis PFTS motif protein